MENDDNCRREKSNYFTTSVTRLLDIPEWRETDYIEDAELGKGAQGRVIKADLAQIGTVAIKLYKDEDRDRISENKEIQYLSKIDHQNVIRFLGMITDYSDETFSVLGVVMEYFPGTDLAKVIDDKKKKYGYKEAVDWMSQAAIGLSYIKSQKLAHRDVKPANMLLDVNNSVLKLCDFGCICLPEIENTARTGTPAYWAPEMNCDIGRIKTEYGFGVDVYSFAITFWQTLVRKKPYVIMHSADWREAVSKKVAPYRPDLMLVTDDDIKIWIHRCWQTEPELRPPIEEVKDWLIKKKTSFLPSNGTEYPLPEFDKNEKLRRISELKLIEAESTLRLHNFTSSSTSGQRTSEQPDSTTSASAIITQLKSAGSFSQGELGDVFEGVKDLILANNIEPLNGDSHKKWKQLLGVLSPKLRPVVFLDIEYNEKVNRVQIELYVHEVPLTAENFRCLCTGEKEIGRSGKLLNYKGTSFYAHFSNCIAGGNILSKDKQNEKGFAMDVKYKRHSIQGLGESIYGGLFSHEKYNVTEHRRGIVSMEDVVGSGDKCGSSFVILLEDVSWMDGIRVAVGEVVRGIEYLDEANSWALESPSERKVVVANCGQFLGSDSLF